MPTHTLRSTALTGLLVFECFSQSPVQPAGAAQVRKGLEALAASSGDWAAFAVTYDDLHGLHGGLTLTIRGDGQVEQRAVRTEVGKPRRVPRPDLQRLVARLLEVRAWEQRTATRTAAADESTTRLIVRSGGAEVTIWEWYNDMRQNARIVRVRDLMTEIAWQPKVAAP
jgi:hypothetical protein